jgi:hypothetical protein
MQTRSNQGRKCTGLIGHIINLVGGPVAATLCPWPAPTRAICWLFSLSLSPNSDPPFTPREFEPDLVSTNFRRVF